MVSVVVSKLGCMELFLVEPGVKVNGEYYRNVLLTEKMLPAIWRMASDFFIFQQDSAQQYIEQRTPLRCCDVKHQASLDRNSGQQTHQTSIQLTTEFPRKQKFRAMNGAHLASPIRGELGYAHWPQLGTQFIALLGTKFGAH